MKYKHLYCIKDKIIIGISVKRMMKMEGDTMMKKAVKLFVAVMMIFSMFSLTTFAAGWTTGQEENSSRWWYDLGDGSYYAGNQSGPSWQWLDGNQDGVAECYAFDAEGWMYANTTTPDGYQVNVDGAWVINGTVQTQNMTLVSQEDTDKNNILIVYFSRTNTTEYAANLIQQQVGGIMFEIQPADPYPSSYSTTTDRAQREINAGILPDLAADIENFDDFDVVFIGYPIWWGTTPPVINTFLNAHNFTGKTVIPFCTSGGSGINGSLRNINRYCVGATILEGRDITRDGESVIRSWLSEIGMVQ